jgi:hypothetical protein
MNPLLIKIKKVLLLCTNKLWFFGLLNGVAANIELRKFLHNIKPSSIIDIGSNKGQFILLNKGLFKNLFIYSFEPQRNEIKIQKKIFKHFKISSDLIENFNYEIKKEEKINIKQIKNVLNFKTMKRPILVKIDVQGYEKKVLEGFGNSIKYIDFFIIEVSNLEMYENQPKSKEIINFLSRRKFKIIKKNKWNKVQENKKIKQTDILFQNNEN